MAENGIYTDARDILIGFLGCKVVDIQTVDHHVRILFEDQSWIDFPVGDDGFDWNPGDRNDLVSFVDEPSM